MKRPVVLFVSPAEKVEVEAMVLPMSLTSLTVQVESSRSTSSPIRALPLELEDPPPLPPLGPPEYRDDEDDSAPTRKSNHPPTSNPPQRTKRIPTTMRTITPAPSPELCRGCA